MAPAEHRPDDSVPDGPGSGTSRRRGRAQIQRDFEMAFFGAVLERDPAHSAALRAHAANLAATGQYNRALQADRRLVRLHPERPAAWYNLACSYALLGLTDPAFSALQRALELGYNHYGHLCRDPDLKSLRRDPRFLRLVRRAMTSRG